MPHTSDENVLRPAPAAGVPDDALAEINRLWTIVRAFSNTAHDVNNALQVVAGSAELLELRDLDPAIKRRVETIRVEAGKAAGAINQLLTYAQSSAPALQPQDLWPIVERAVDMRVASTGRRRVALVVDRANAAPCWALVDGHRLQQAVIDLLLTAEDRVCRSGDARIVVRAARQRDEATIVLTASCDPGTQVSDTETASSPADAFTSGAQLWAAAHLAAAQSGRVTLEESEAMLTLTLRVPAGQ